MNAGPDGPGEPGGQPSYCLCDPAHVLLALHRTTNTWRGAWRRGGRWWRLRCRNAGALPSAPSLRQQHPRYRRSTTTSRRPSPACPGLASSAAIACSCSNPWASTRAGAMPPFTRVCLMASARCSDSASFVTASTEASLYRIRLQHGQQRMHRRLRLVSESRRASLEIQIIEDEPLRRRVG
jgi:hypothetical protein